MSTAVIEVPKRVKGKRNLCRAFDDCGRTVHATGLCRAHLYQQQQGYGLTPIKAPIRRWKNKGYVLIPGEGHPT